MTQDYEFSNVSSHYGRIEVVTGSMFSGKTEELIRRIRRARIANLRVEEFKPSIDKRYADGQIVSHDAHSVDCTAVEASSEILFYSEEADIVAIDEAQFFDNALPDVCLQLARMGKRVIVAGLDMDYKGSPFGTMPQLMAIADEVLKLHAVCIRCGAEATLSHRKTQDTAKVLLGEADEYEPLCRHCYAHATSEARPDNSPL